MTELKYMNPFSLEGKRIVITGASSGIGRQCAVSCTRMGAQVILIGRREEKLLETIELLSSSGNLHYTFDITDYQKTEQVIMDVVAKTGPLNGFIHSAGKGNILPLSVTKPSHYQELFAVNAIAGFEFARVISKKKYIAPEGGSFVFISSVRGSLGEVAQTAYCSSKGAIIAGVKAMALELGEKRIRVNAISPAMIEGTEMTAKMLENLNEENKKRIMNMHPSGFGKPEDVANGCIYLLSEASRWVTGTNLIIDGGYSAK
jgi:NAD(P)-dependent dehydrogenase (short-subunit alcohol dehydrogenase family)